ncbi:MAG: UDP-N-acetylmuramoyl-L-alanine--D-glutamate ligase [Phycisphaerae bacterium]|nr:UDP-N-acetylmuramoyl-L-alanine--D-glutamate ligase [Phycisphaerae bacterium]
MTKELAGRRVTVMGLGLFGGGLGVAKWLHAQGAIVRITDRRDAAVLADAIAALEPLRERGRLEIECGTHTKTWFTQTDLLVANAAVPTPWSHPLLCSARDAGVPVTTEIRLSIEAIAARRTIGITGSAGKSTTSAMTLAALRASGRRAEIGGNYGGSLLGSSDAERADWLVLELSSAQLWWLSDAAADWSGQSRLGWRPTIGALTNLAPNHVDWHGSVEHYLMSKQGIVPNTGHLVTWFADDDADAERAAAAAAGAERVWWRTTPPAVALEGLALAVPGAHMVQNARTALALLDHACAIDGQPIDRIAATQAISSFQGLPHRMQRIGEWNGVACFNDSKSTTPAATMRALESFADLSRVHLIAGGYDKHIDLSGIAGLAPRLAGLYAVGQVQEQLATAGGTRCGTLDTAVRAAFARARTGDSILLSPACASLDQYPNFEHRGEHFIDLVRTAATAESR